MALQLLRERIAEDSLITSMLAYLSKMEAICAFVSEEELLYDWPGLGEVYPR